MKNEPAITISLVLAVVMAGVHLAAEFGLDLTSGQQTAIEVFVGAVLTLAAGFYTRSLVTPAWKADQLGTSHAEREARNRAWNGEDPDPDAEG